MSPQPNSTPTPILYASKTSSDWPRHAAELASEAWEDASSSGDWNKVDATCFKLCVLDDAVNLKDEWDDSDEWVYWKTVPEFLNNITRFITQAYQDREASLRSANEAHARRLAPDLDFEAIREFCQRVLVIHSSAGAGDCKDIMGFKALEAPIEPSEYGAFDPNDAFARGEVEIFRYTVPMDAIDKPYTGTAEDDIPRFTEPELVVPRKRVYESSEQRTGEQHSDEQPSGDHHDASTATDALQPETVQPLQPTGSSVADAPVVLSPTGPPTKVQRTDAGPEHAEPASGAARADNGPAPAAEDAGKSTAGQPEPSDAAAATAPAVEVDAAVTKDAAST